MNIVALFTFWRIGLWITAWGATLFLPFLPRFPYADVYLEPSEFPSWFWSFGNFDGVHYLTIAQQGYAAQFTQVFFPLYPLLVHFVGLLFAKNNLIAGLIISNTCFILFLRVFSRFIVDLGYKREKVWILLSIMTFPFSFFFGSIYSESLFALLVILTFYLASKNNYFLASVCGMFAGLTRLVGVFLFPALIIFFLEKKKIFTKSSLFLLLIPLGVVFYMFYLWWFFHDPLYFWHAQPVFGAARSGSVIILPPQVLYRYIKILFTVSATSYAFWVAFWELCSFSIACFLLIIAHRKKLSHSLLFFSWSCLLLPVLTGTFSSMPRYTLILFPLYIVLGTIASRWLRFGVLCINCILLLFFTALFTRGFWVS